MPDEIRVRAAFAVNIYLFFNVLAVVRSLEDVNRRYSDMLSWYF